MSDNPIQALRELLCRIDNDSQLTSAQKEMMALGAVLSHLDALYAPSDTLFDLQCRLMDEHRYAGRRGERPMRAAQRHCVLNLLGASAFLQDRCMSAAASFRAVSSVMAELGHPVTFSAIKNWHYGWLQREPQSTRDRVSRIADAIEVRRRELSPLPAFAKLSDTEHVEAWLRSEVVRPSVSQT